MSLDTARTIATLRGLTSKFDTAVASATPFYPSLCTVVPSSGADEQYGFLGAMPGMREWLGDRVFHTLKGADYTLKNREWENSVKIEKNDIDDDRLGLYGLPLQQLGVEAAHHPDELLFEIIENADSSECFDGQNFFDTDHQWGDSGVQSNKLTHTAATGTTPTESEFRAAYAAARKAMMTFKRDNGKPFYRPTITPNTGIVMLVPPDLQEIAAQAMTKEVLANGETNVILDKPSKIIACPYLTDSAKFQIYDTSKPLKPFVFQARRPLQRQMKGLDDREFKDVKLMTDARYNVGYLAWWLAVSVEFT